VLCKDAVCASLKENGRIWAGFSWLRIRALCCWREDGDASGAGARGGVMNRGILLSNCQVVTVGHCCVELK
jgi:hypothetical protein